MPTAPKWAYGTEIVFEPPKRTVRAVYIHCTASDNLKRDDVSFVRQTHIGQNGWSDVGYHFIVNKNGNIQEGRPIEKTPAAQQGHNSGTIAISLHGLLEENFTKEQFTSLIAFCTTVNKAYKGQLTFHGHCEVEPRKTCPVFNYKEVLGLDGGGLMKGATTTTPTRKQKPTAAGTGVTRVKGAIQILDRGKHVEVCQNLLVMNGESVRADGAFGQETREAVRRFQSTVGLARDGVVGPRTRLALIAGNARMRDLKRGMTGDDVRALQAILAAHQIPGKKDGSFGPELFASVQVLQRRRGLPLTGVVSKETRAVFF